MVYYPITTLIESGVREFCLISTPHDLPRFEQLLGDGKAWGISIEYRAQQKPAGIAETFLIAESFINKDHVALVLGDNIFCGGDAFHKAFADFKGVAAMFWIKEKLWQKILRKNFLKAVFWKECLWGSPFNPQPPHPPKPAGKNWRSCCGGRNSAVSESEFRPATLPEYLEGKEANA